MKSFIFLEVIDNIEISKREKFRENWVSRASDGFWTKKNREKQKNDGRIQEPRDPEDNLYEDSNGAAPHRGRSVTADWSREG